MNGKTEEEVVVELKGQGLNDDEINKLLPFKVFDGNQPSTTILIKKLSPKSLGKLLALYEHKVFVQGILWNINSFDQFGVELGKELSRKISGELSSVSKRESPLLSFYKQTNKFCSDLYQINLLL